MVRIFSRKNLGSKTIKFPFLDSFPKFSQCFQYWDQRGLCSGLDLGFFFPGCGVCTQIPGPQIPVRIQGFCWENQGFGVFFLHIFANSKVPKIPKILIWKSIDSSGKIEEFWGGFFSTFLPRKKGLKCLKLMWKFIDSLIKSRDLFCFFFQDKGA